MPRVRVALTANWHAPSGCLVHGACDMALRYGVILKAQGALDEARAAMADAVNAFPLNWSAWSDLAALCRSREEVRCQPPP